MATAKKPEVTGTAAKTTEKTTAKAAEKKITAAKTTASKTTAAKTTAAKKTPVKKTAPKKPAVKKTATEKIEVFVEFGGVQVAINDVIENVKATNGKNAKSYQIYLKPEESKAYFVADGEEKEMDVFFC